ncbi:phospholipase A2 inhibitor gamma subunit B-like [Carettochelys insculpta]|uniref:phospholipase A2 inhibitor gamma subunit B-like n=1 Tax=Carettochelys insculpta TaxID=44489 RepID=UPI003EBD1EEC
MKSSLAVCVLAALLAMGACLRCKICSGDECDSDPQTCPASKDSCILASIESMLGGQKSRTDVRDCVTSSQCRAGPISVNFGKGKTIRMSIACCQVDDCKPDVAKVPAPDTKPNGWRCPACYSQSPEQCREETINCSGVETQCIHIPGPRKMTGTSTPTFMKGCATELTCAHITGELGKFMEIIGDLPNAKCTPASAGASITLRPAGLLFPALLGRLLTLHS